MKKQNNKLNFSTNTIVELKNEELNEIEGGTSWGCFGISVLLVCVTVADHQVISVVHH